MHRTTLRISQPEVVWEGALAGFGAVSADLSAIASLRQAPGVAETPRIPPRFLLHADEQSVVGLAAVLQAIDANGWTAEQFSQWGVVGAPRYAGRGVGAVMLPKYGQGGPAVISPHFIPQLSLHSLSGVLSVALGMHGPNFGAGGGPGSLEEGLLAALTMLEDGQTPGVWLTLTEWSPELVRDASGEPIGESPICHAAALALTSNTSDAMRLRIWRSDAGAARPASSGAVQESARPLSVSRLVARLKTPYGPAWRCRLLGDCQLEIASLAQRQRQAA